MLDITKKYCMITSKVYNNGKHKLSCKNGFLPAKGIERPRLYYNLNKDEKIDLQTGELLQRLHSLRSAKTSAHRAKNVLLDIIESTNFEWFVALTFDNSKVERLNDSETRKKFTQWQEYMRRKFPEMYYVAVPEYHAKGGLHFHMLLGNITAEQLKLVYSGNVCASFTKKGNCSKAYFDKVSKNFELKITDGLPIYNITAWKYGFSTASEVQNTEAVKHYLTDYITKGHVDERFFSKKRFFCSQNVLRPFIEKYKILLSSNQNFESIVYYDENNIEKMLESENLYLTEDYGVEYRDSDKQYVVFTNDKTTIKEIEENVTMSVPTNNENNTVELIRIIKTMEEQKEYKENLKNIVYSPIEDKETIQIVNSMFDNQIKIEDIFS